MRIKKHPQFSFGQPHTPYLTRGNSLVHKFQRMLTSFTFKYPSRQFSWYITVYWPVFVNVSENCYDNWIHIFLSIFSDWTLSHTRQPPLQGSLSWCKVLLTVASLPNPQPTLALQHTTTCNWNYDPHQAPPQLASVVHSQHHEWQDSWDEQSQDGNQWHPDLHRWFRI